MLEEIMHDKGTEVTGSTCQEYSNGPDSSDIGKYKGRGVRESRSRIHTE